MAQRIVLNETSYHGKGAIAELATEVERRGFKKAFVCSDPDLVKFGVTKKVTDVLDNAGYAYELYSNIKPNPNIQKTNAPQAKSIKFFIIILPAFFALVNPVSTIANPACIKNTKAAPNNTQIVSTDEYIINPPNN